MAIVITRGLEAHPRLIPLPGGTQLRQSLQVIGLPQDQVRIEYSLEPNGDVAFAGGIFTLVFNEVIGSGGTDLAHNVAFVNVTGQPVGTFEVDETITDSQGDETPDLCNIDVQ
jgi:hypothetical protein